MAVLIGKSTHNLPSMERNITLNTDLMKFIQKPIDLLPLSIDDTTDTQLQNHSDLAFLGSFLSA